MLKDDLMNYIVILSDDVCNDNNNDNNINNSNNVIKTFQAYTLLLIFFLPHALRGK